MIQGKKVIGASLAIAISCMSGAAIAGTAEAAPVQAAAGTHAEGAAALTSSDWKAIAARARAAGDSESAVAAATMAQRSAGGPVTYNLVTDLAKRAIIAVLRHGGTKVPGVVGKWSSKIIGVIESVDGLEQAPLIYALMKSGIPYSDAQYIAQWITTFAGI